MTRAVPKLLEEVQHMFSLRAQRDVRCGTMCKLCYDVIDHCAYCRVEEGIGPYGWELPPLSEEVQHMFSLRAQKKCPFCGREVDPAEFRDELSIREFEISGLCQKCQDDFFGRE